MFSEESVSILGPKKINVFFKVRFLFQQRGRKHVSVSVQDNMIKSILSL